MAQVSSNTPKRILLGEGVFYFNYGEAGELAVGATRGGGSFNREVEIRDLEYDGKVSPTKGMRSKDSSIARLMINTLEVINKESVVKFYAGLQVDESGATEDVVTAKENIEDADYLSNVAFVGKTKDDRDVVVVVKNALGDGNLEWALENNNDVVPEVQFTGHADPDDHKTEPWELRYPK